jgi:D-glycero-D-manno-heptose 1,7-bisphosphate phosphatase
MKAVFLDRDGVINYPAAPGEYIAHWWELRFLPGVFEATAGLVYGGYELFVVTNQRGVAMGKITARDLAEIHDRMHAEFLAAGVKLKDVYCCTHHVEDRCYCRKPSPGMLLQAAAEHGICLAESWMVGDKIIDLQAGRAAGCRTAFIQRSSFPDTEFSPEVVAPSLLAAVPRILAYTPAPQDTSSFRS